MGTRRKQKSRHDLVDFIRQIRVALFQQLGRLRYAIGSQYHFARVRCYFHGMCTRPCVCCLGAGGGNDT